MKLVNQDPELKKLFSEIANNTDIGKLVESASSNDSYYSLEEYTDTNTLWNRFKRYIKIESSSKKNNIFFNEIY